MSKRNRFLSFFGFRGNSTDATAHGTYSPSAALPCTCGLSGVYSSQHGPYKGGVVSATLDRHNRNTSRCPRHEGKRPLKGVVTQPPEYLVDPRIFIESYVEIEVQYVGEIRDVPRTFNLNSRSQILGTLDRAKSTRQLPWMFEACRDDAVASLNVHSVKFVRGAQSTTSLTKPPSSPATSSHRVGSSLAETNGSLLDRIPTYQIAALTCLREGAQNIVVLKVAVPTLAQLQQQQQTQLLRVSQTPTRPSSYISTLNSSVCGVSAAWTPQGGVQSPPGNNPTKSLAAHLARYRSFQSLNSSFGGVMAHNIQDATDLNPSFCRLVVLNFVQYSHAEEFCQLCRQVFSTLASELEASPSGDSMLLTARESVGEQRDNDVFGSQHGCYNNASPAPLPCHYCATNHTAANCHEGFLAQASSPSSPYHRYSSSGTPTQSLYPGSPSPSSSTQNIVMVRGVPVSLRQQKACTQIYDGRGTPLVQQYPSPHSEHIPGRRSSLPRADWTQSHQNSGRFYPKSPLTYPPESDMPPQETPSSPRPPQTQIKNSNPTTLRSLSSPNSLPKSASMYCESSARAPLTPTTPLHPSQSRLAGDNFRESFTPPPPPPHHHNDNMAAFVPRHMLSNNNNTASPQKYQSQSAQGRPQNIFFREEKFRNGGPASPLVQPVASCSSLPEVLFPNNEFTYPILEEHQAGLQAPPPPRQAQQLISASLIPPVDVGRPSRQMTITTTPSLPISRFSSVQEEAEEETTPEDHPHSPPIPEENHFYENALSVESDCVADILQSYEGNLAVHEIQSLAGLLRRYKSETGPNRLTIFNVFCAIFKLIPETDRQLDIFRHIEPLLASGDSEMYHTYLKQIEFWHEDQALRLKEETQPHPDDRGSYHYTPLDVKTDCPSSPDNISLNDASLLSALAEMPAPHNGYKLVDMRSGDGEEERKGDGNVEDRSRVFHSDAFADTYNSSSSSSTVPVEIRENQTPHTVIHTPDSHTNSGELISSGCAVHSDEYLREGCEDEEGCEKGCYKTLVTSNQSSVRSEDSAKGTSLGASSFSSSTNQVTFSSLSSNNDLFSPSYDPHSDFSPETTPSIVDPSRKGVLGMPSRPLPDECLELESVINQLSRECDGSAGVTSH